MNAKIPLILTMASLSLITAQAQDVVPAPATAAPTKGFIDVIKDAVSRVFSGFLDIGTISLVFRVIFTVAIGLLLVGLVIALVKRLTKDRLDPRTRALVVKIGQYTGLALIVINAFNAANVDLTALLGAAGIVGIAIGFAAQTSVSNFISGFFLVSEKTFAIDDVLSVGDVSGVVFSIDTLSVKLRTFDNKLVRIPNETLIKSTVTNVTRFPLRRMNVTFTITYENEFDRVRAILMEIAASLPSILKNPEPFFMITGFGKDGLEVFFGVWFEKTDWEPTILGIHRGIKERFDREGIKFAHQTITMDGGENQKK